MSLGSHLCWGWVPDHVPTLRGALILNGYTAGVSPTWREWATYQGYAVIRICTDGYDTSHLEEPRHLALATMVANSLSELGRRTGHPELRHVPLVSSGFSRFSGFSARGMYEAFPTRHLAHANGFGPNGSPPSKGLPGTWTKVPSLFMATEFEDTYGVGDSLQVNRLTDRPWRRYNGLLRGMCMTRGNRHDPFNYHELAAVFFDQVIQQRVPTEWDPHSGPATLAPIKQADGWLGDNQIFYHVEREITEPELVPDIAAYADFNGDPLAASWLPNRASAFVWRGFSMGRPLATVIGPSHPGLPGQVHWKGGQGQMARDVLHLEHNLRDQVPFTVTARCEVGDITAIDVFANDQQLGTITAFSGGETPTGNTTSATGQLSVTLPAGVYGLMLRYTRAGGGVGWSRPALITVFPAEL